MMTSSIIGKYHGQNGRMISLHLTTVCLIIQICCCPSPSLAIEDLVDGGWRNHTRPKYDDDKWMSLVSINQRQRLLPRNNDLRTTWQEQIDSSYHPPPPVNLSASAVAETTEIPTESSNIFDISSSHSNEEFDCSENEQLNCKDLEQDLKASRNSGSSSTKLRFRRRSSAVEGNISTTSLLDIVAAQNSVSATDSPAEQSFQSTEYLIVLDDDDLTGVIRSGLDPTDLEPLSSSSSASSLASSTYDSEENATCTDDKPCPINHNTTCVGDVEYCNLTREQYFELLYDYIYPTTPEWILIFSHTVVFIMGLVGNALVCIAVYTNYSMRTVTNIFIVNLAVADFFVILFCLPPTVVWDVTETWFMGKAMCKVVLYFQTVSVTVSVLTLTFISIDRWYAICFPLRYRTKISRAIASVAVIWIVALLSDIPEFLVLTTKKKIELRFDSILFTQCVTTWDKDTEKNFYIARFIMLYTLPLLLMTIAYFKIVRVLWKSETIPGHRESRNHQYTCGYLRGSCVPSANSSTMGQLRARRKAAKMLVAVVVMFGACYFPVHLLNILRYAIDIGQNEITAVLSLFSHWLCYANSAVNPVIYNFMSGKFRREFRNALEKCRCARVRVEDRSLNHSTPASRINNISPSTRSNYQLTSVRDITRDNVSRQTLQTTFIDNCGNGHSATPMLNHTTKTERVP